jgi:hypothetical protein
MHDLPRHHDSLLHFPATWSTNQKRESLVTQSGPTRQAQTFGTRGQIRIAGMGVSRLNVGWVVLGLLVVGGG